MGPASADGKHVTTAREASQSAPIVTRVVIATLSVL